MTTHFQREIQHIKKRIVSLSAAVEKSVTEAVRALEKKDVQLAYKVIEEDDQIDTLEVELEEDCLKILALHQPVAIDLRYLVAILKINSDLERIGDLAVNVAQGAIALSQQDRIRLPEHITEMAGCASSMLHTVIDAVLSLNADLAQEVLNKDDEIDKLHVKTYEMVESILPEQPELTKEYVRLVGISRNLERIGDLTTNIAEDVLYTVRGEIVRHGVEGGVDGG